MAWLIFCYEEELKDTLLFDTWLMSCSLLKRGVEEYVLNGMVKVAGKMDIGN